MCHFISSHLTPIHRPTLISMSLIDIWEGIYWKFTTGSKSGEWIESLICSLRMSIHSPILFPSKRLPLCSINECTLCVMLSLRGWGVLMVYGSNKKKWRYRSSLRLTVHTLYAGCGNENAMLSFTDLWDMNGGDTFSRCDRHREHKKNMCENPWPESVLHECVFWSANNEKGENGFSWDERECMPMYSKGSPKFKCYHNLGKVCVYQIRVSVTGWQIENHDEMQTSGTKCYWLELFIRDG